MHWGQGVSFERGGSSPLSKAEESRRLTNLQAGNASLLFLACHHVLSSVAGDVAFYVCWSIGVLVLSSF